MEKPERKDLIKISDYIWKILGLGTRQFLYLNLKIKKFKSMDIKKVKQYFMESEEVFLWGGTRRMTLCHLYANIY